MSGLAVASVENGATSEAPSAPPINPIDSLRFRSLACGRCAQIIRGKLQLSSAAFKIACSHPESRLAADLLGGRHWVNHVRRKLNRSGFKGVAGAVTPSYRPTGRVTVSATMGARHSRAMLKDSPLVERKTRPAGLFSPSYRPDA